MREQNESKGMAPTITRTFAKYESWLGSVAPETRHQKLPKTLAGIWYWGKGWASQWEVTGGMLKANVRLPLEQKRAKAGRYESRAVSPTCPKVQHVWHGMWPNFRPEICGRKLGWNSGLEMG